MIGPYIQADHIGNYYLDLFAFQELRSNLEEAKDETKVTVEDKQYQILLDGNRDKFKTLRDIRSGATKRRIDKFENL